MRLIDADTIDKYLDVVEVETKEYGKYNAISYDELGAVPSVNVETIKPHPTEAIVVRYDGDKLSIREFTEWFKTIKWAFPDNTVVGIPNDITLESYSVDVLENIISMISEIIDKKLR